MIADMFDYERASAPPATLISLPVYIVCRLGERGVRRIVALEAKRAQTDPASYIHTYSHCF